MPDQDDFDRPAITRGRPPERPVVQPKRGISQVRLAAIAVAVVLVALAWAFRWEVTPAEGGASTQSRAYLLDRWTGTLYFVAGPGKYTVKLDD